MRRAVQVRIGFTLVFALSVVIATFGADPPALTAGTKKKEATPGSPGSEVSTPQPEAKVVGGKSAVFPAYTPRPPRTENKALKSAAKTASSPVGTKGYAAPAKKEKYVHSGAKWSRSVALTFDDGPNAKHTPKLLRYLRDQHIPATFFLVGTEVEKHQDIVIEMAEFGFEIGNHSWNHPNLEKASKEKIEGQLDNTSDLIERISGKRPTLFRPPYGATSKILREACEARKMETIMWSLDTNDWKSGMDADKIMEYVEKDLKGGSIILMHDRLSHTIEAVPRIVELARARGLRFVTVTQLLREKRSPMPSPTPKTPPKATPNATAQTPKPEARP